MAGSYGGSIFNFLRTLHNSYTNLHSHQKITKIPFSLHPHQQMLSLLFLITVILTGVRWYIMMVLISNSLMISDAEHPFMDLLATCISSVENCLFKPLAHFKSDYHYFHSSVVWFLYPLSDIWLANIFSHSVKCFFHLVDWFFWYAEAF